MSVYESHKQHLLKLQSLADLSTDDLKQKRSLHLIRDRNSLKLASPKSCNTKRNNCITLLTSWRTVCLCCDATWSIISFTAFLSISRHLHTRVRLADSLNSGGFKIDSSVQSTRYVNMKSRPFMLMMIQLLQLDGRMTFHPFQKRAGQESLVENKLT
ncbi:uncharacterized protein LOC134263103 isoform X1 [Saccostrea cucullata]|uniref:uncharacterized protein LOC134263103 isoform X1 n=1 Tax=Saccostrea cuccullata TaxID=36930 RepID=UPI002ED00BB9